MCLRPVVYVYSVVHVCTCRLVRIKLKYANNSPTGAARMAPTFRRKMRLKMLWICCMLSTVENRNDDDCWLLVSSFWFVAFSA